MTAHNHESERPCRSGLQKACAVLFVGLIALAMIGTCVIAILDLPPACWVNRAQDALFDFHFPMLGFIVTMIPMVVLAAAIGLPIVRIVRAYMDRQGIPWVDADEDVTE